MCKVIGISAITETPTLKTRHGGHFCGEKRGLQRHESERVEWGAVAPQLYAERCGGAGGADGFVGGNTFA
jgi:hypothetical protein